MQILQVYRIETQPTAGVRVFAEELRFLALGHSHCLSSNSQEPSLPRLMFGVRECLLSCLFSLLSSMFSSILGMQLFGGQFCTFEAFNLTSRTPLLLKCTCCTCGESRQLRKRTDVKDLHCVQKRQNFDRLSDALLTVFQVLLGVPLPALHVRREMTGTSIDELCPRS